MSTCHECEMILARLKQIDSELISGCSPWMNTTEAAEFLRCSKSLIERLTREGKIPFQRQNPTVDHSIRLYHRKDLTVFLVTGKNMNSTKLTCEEKKEVERLLI